MSTIQIPRNLFLDALDGVIHSLWRLAERFGNLIIIFASQILLPDLQFQRSKQLFLAVLASILLLFYFVNLGEFEFYHCVSAVEHGSFYL